MKLRHFASICLLSSAQRAVMKTLSYEISLYFFVSEVRKGIFVAVGIAADQAKADVLFLFFSFHIGRN